MAINYRKESSQLLYDFLMYHKNIQNHSAKTVQEYFLDLRTFFRYLIWLETDEALMSFAAKSLAGSSPAILAAILNLPKR